MTLPSDINTPEKFPPADMFSIEAAFTVAPTASIAADANTCISLFIAGLPSLLF